MADDKITEDILRSLSLDSKQLRIYKTDDSAPKEVVHIYGFMPYVGARTLRMFCEVARIPYVWHEVDIFRKEQRSEEFLSKVNPYGLLPAIQVGDFVLTETSAILLYLCRKYNLEDQWYPKDPYVRARIEECLHWSIENLTPVIRDLFIVSSVEPILQLTPVDVVKAEKCEKQAIDRLKLFVDVFLDGGKSKFVLGERVSIADMFAASGVAQLYTPEKLLPFEKILPVVDNWYTNVREAIPVFEPLHIAMQNDLIRVLMEHSGGGIGV